MGGAFTADTLKRDQNVFQNSTYGSKYIVVVGAFDPAQWDLGGLGHGQISFCISPVVYQ